MTAYAYGLERIAAYTENSKTSYVYDGRGSVAQTISAPVAGEAVSSVLPDVAVKAQPLEGQSFSYTAFGEQYRKSRATNYRCNWNDFGGWSRSNTASDQLGFRLDYRHSFSCKQIRGILLCVILFN